jgi:hypothetical protein
VKNTHFLSGLILISYNSNGIGFLPIFRQAQYFLPFDRRMNFKKFTQLSLSYIMRLCLLMMAGVIPFFSKAQSSMIPSIPQPAFFTPIQIGIKPTGPIQNGFIPKMGMVEHNEIDARNQRMLEQLHMAPGPTNPGQVSQLADIERDVKEFSMNREEMEWLKKTKHYRGAFAALSRMNPDSFSITKAVFFVENAYLNDSLTFAEFDYAVKERADLVQQILKREGLPRKNNTALNYGIQKLYEQPNKYYHAQSGKVITVPPIKYDFTDIRGEIDYRKMFVSKLLATGTGQCHSMPLLYLLIAEHLGAKANLSLSPQHSFVQFPDNNGALVNFETTNGNLVSNTWMVESGFITTEALQHKIYLDTLSQRQLYAQMLSDLLLGYLHNFPYDELAEAMKQRILQINPTSLTALIVDANRKTNIFLQKVNAAGRPKESDLPKYPDVYKAFLAMNASYQKIDNLGYQDMPKEAYQRWLQSIEAERKKQSSREMQEKLQREIQHLRTTKPTLKNNIKD